MAEQAAESRTALVTGASSGIGTHIARRLAQLGWTVAIGARREDRLAEVAASIEKSGGRAFAHALDVSSADSIDAFFDAAASALDPFDVVVNNAGIGIPGRVHELAPADIQREIATNLLGPILVTRRALPPMLERHRGDIVFITSANAVSPRPWQIGYTTSKSGLEGFARTLRLDLEGTGVRSTIIRPGPTQSEFGDSWDNDRLLELVESWKSFGFMRHLGLLHGTAIADALVAAVTAPAGTHLDEIQINPEAPVDE